jgi:hypothetical protein
MNNGRPLDELKLEELLQMPQYSLDDGEKNFVLLRLIKEQLPKAMRNPHIKSLFAKQNIDIEKIQSVEGVPFIPVQMFKHFDLSTNPDEKIARVIKSSGTTSGGQSIVPISKEAAANQMKGLKSILENYMGQKRRVMIAIDHKGVNDPKKEITARGAGIRGFSIYAKETVYVLKEYSNGELVLDMPVIEKLQKEYADRDVYAFGFTYIIWKTFCKQMRDKGLKLKFNDAIVFHGGGWKKLTAEKVSKEEFSKEIADLLGTRPEKVRDYYGMAEQTGIIYVDCEQGNKHVPNFSQVIVRDMRTLKPCGVGEKGLIEVMGVLSNSYYSYGILTEDIGHLEGEGGCPCGRKGRYFRFDSRVERAELRGCGDTFRE